MKANNAPLVLASRNVFHTHDNNILNDNQSETTRVRVPYSKWQRTGMLLCFNGWTGKCPSTRIRVEPSV